MGRPRKPTELKRQQGTLDASRTNPCEPSLPPEFPQPPDDLSDEVLAAYMLHGQLLLDMRVLTRAHGPALVAMSQAYCDLREAVATLKANGGSYIESESGMVRAHPAVAIRNEADRRYRGWLQSFGMTPADQSKVNAQAEQKKSGLALLLEESDADEARVQ